MTRRQYAVVAAIIVTILGVAATAIPGQSVLGMDEAYVGALEVAVAAGAATVLLWYAFR